jgi:hypothetical protein
MQATLVDINAVPLVCYLLSQPDHESQMDGIKLGNFLLLHLNTDAQDLFYKHFRGSADTYTSVGTNSLSSIAGKLVEYDAEILCRFGEDRIERLLDFKKILVYLQSLCSGQHTNCQELMAEESVYMGQKSMIGIIVGILISEFQGFKAIPLSEISEMELRLDVVQQCMDTLVDFISGPNLVNENALLQSDYHLIEILRSWIEYADELRLNLMDRLHLPPLEQLRSPLLVMLFSPQTKQMKEKAKKYWELLDMVDEVEISALFLISALMEDSINYLNDDEADDVGEVDVGSQERMQKIIPILNIPGMIQRFKVLWASVVFERGFLGKYFKMRRKELGQMEIFGYADKVFDQFNRIQALIFDNSDAAFRPDTIKHLSTEKKDLYIRLWMSSRFDEERQEKNTRIAFTYYEILTSLADKYLDKDYVTTCNPDFVQILATVESQWTSREDGKTLITQDEAEAFDNYFANIEVVLKKRLQRVYFPIPRACRDQKANPVVLVSYFMIVIP